MFLVETKTSSLQYLVMSATLKTVTKLRVEVNLESKMCSNMERDMRWETSRRAELAKMEKTDPPG